MWCGWEGVALTSGNFITWDCVYEGAEQGNPCRVAQTVVADWEYAREQEWKGPGIACWGPSQDRCPVCPPPHRASPQGHLELCHVPWKGVQAGVGCELGEAGMGGMANFPHHPHLRCHPHCIFWPFLALFGFFGCQNCQKTPKNAKHPPKNAKITPKTLKKRQKCQKTPKIAKKPQKTPNQCQQNPKKRQKRPKMPKMGAVHTQSPIASMPPMSGEDLSDTCMLNHQ